MFIVAGIIILLTILFVFLSGLAAYKLLHPKRVSIEISYKLEREGKEIPPNYYDQNPQFFVITSMFGYSLTGNYIKGYSNKLVVFCHGISWNRLGSLKYLEHFISEGWHIIYYDHRGAGESGGKYPSFGKYEKFDLKSIIDYAYSIIPEVKSLVLHGESMGASTVLQYSGMDERISAIIAYCPFSNLKDLLYYNFRSIHLPNFMDPFLLFLIDLVLKYVGKFQMSEINPQKDILNSNLPLMIVHGKKDHKVPYSMSKNLVDKRQPISPTHFHSFEEDGHTPGLYLHNRSYLEKETIEFLRTYTKDSL
jgi:uncharacterized protein